MDNVTSIDTVQMAMVLYAIKKSQQIEKDVNTSLIKETTVKLRENLKEVESQEENTKNLEKGFYPWLGQNIDKLL